MPGAWSKPREFARLADSRAEFEVEIPVNELPGIPAEWKVAPALVAAQLRFLREQGQAMAEVAVRARLTGTCQRCLQALQLPVESASRVALVASEDEAGRLPAEYETFLAAEGRCELAALVAEEVLLSLPIVPRHAPGEACALAADEGAAAAEDGEPGGPGDEAPPADTQRPFADLRALLERGKH
jgi:uncharacterized protein